MPKCDIIVVGASAGGVEALRVLAAALPPRLQAAVFVVLHIGNGANGQSNLPAILMAAGPLRAVHARDGETVEYGTMYVAPPDKHLLVSTGHVHLWHGPKINRTRPAIDPLFRSAAENYRDRVAGVILTGMLDDGVAGLAEIRRRGGIALVQNPSSAMYPDLPRNAIEHFTVDDILELEEIAGAITALTTSRREPKVMEQEPRTRTLIKWTCPDCRGPLWEEQQGGIVEYRCRVGHAYSPASLAAEHKETVERTLWSSVVALEEAADIAEQLEAQLPSEAVEDGKKKRRQAEALKKMLGETS